MEAAAVLGDCSYLAGRGAQGLPDLKRLLQAATAEGASWVTRVHLHTAVAKGHVETLQYLIETVRVVTVNEAVHGETPLHVAVIWGRVDCAAYLLAHGADPTRRNGQGETAAEKAKARQGRLLAKLEEDIPLKSDRISIGKDKVKELCLEGEALVSLLEGVERAGSYRAWLRWHRSHPCAGRFSPEVRRWEARARLAVLRELVAAGRAVRRKCAELTIAHVGPATTLESALQGAGLGHLHEQMRGALGPAHSLGDLLAAGVRRQDLAALECSEAERRRIWRLIFDAQSSSLEEAKPKGGKAARGPAGRGKAAQVALASVALQTARAAKGAAQAKPSARGISASGQGVHKSLAQRQSFACGMDILFRTDLPDGAFIAATIFLF